MSFTTCLVIVTLFVVCISAQQQITVPITVEGATFNVRFAPDTMPSVDVAKKLCFENAAKFQLTDANFANCVRPVAEYFQRAVNEYAAKRTVMIPLKIEDNDFRVQFRPDLVSPVDVAKKLCADNAEKLKVTEETFAACVNPIADYLQASVNEYVAERTLTIPIVVEGKDFTIRFRPDLASVSEVAEQFCIQAAGDIGITDETLPACVREIAQYTSNAANKIYEDRMIAVPIKIGEIEFTMRIQPTITSATEAAVKICEGNGEKIGVTKEQVPACVNDVVNYVRRVFTEAVKAEADKAAASTPTDGSSLPASEVAVDSVSSEASASASDAIVAEDISVTTA